MNRWKQVMLLVTMVFVSPCGSGCSNVPSRGQGLDSKDAPDERSSPDVRPNPGGGDWMTDETASGELETTSGEVEVGADGGGDGDFDDGELRSDDPPTVCIRVLPEQIVFPNRKKGTLLTERLTIRNCGTAPLQVEGIHLLPVVSVDLELDLSALPNEPTESNPLEIRPWKERSFRLVFATESPCEPRDIPDLYLGSVVVHSNASVGAEHVHVFQDEPHRLECPVPIIHVAEGDEVDPQTNLRLNGKDSYSCHGEIQKWEWRVEQPLGSQSVFVPSHTFPNPTFEVNVMNVFLFELDVTDESGSRSCEPARKEVIVTCVDERFQIELSWQTPGDPDPTDQGPGSAADLDLHFVHPWASGPDLDGDGEPDGWFDILFDCFWFNPNPNWGSYDPAIDDDPSLDQHGSEAAGQETIRLRFPEEGLTYRVGVHYWNDHGYGPSVAKVQVFIPGQIPFERSGIELRHKDMWEVASIHWPSGVITPATNEDGTPKITPDYVNPYFFAP